MAATAESVMNPDFKARHKHFSFLNWFVETTH
jgi:hypothetical protein